jgi:hypothetical protein
MILEEDILRIKYGIDGDRDVCGLRADDFLWNPIATFLLKRFRLLTAILVGWILWPK